MELKEVLEKIMKSKKPIIIKNISKTELSGEIEIFNISNVSNNNDLKEIYHKFIYQNYLEDMKSVLEINEDLDDYLNRINKIIDEEYGYSFYGEKIKWHMERNFLVVDLDMEYNFHEMFLTPIELKIKEALTINNIAYEMQKELGRYIADFLVEVNNKTFLVECDGKDYHDKERDLERDKYILEKFNYDTLRLTGSEIVSDIDKCIEKINKFSLNIDVSDEIDIKVDMSNEYDEMQMKAIEHIFGTCLITAPAGSGKTSVLIQRIIELIRKGVRPEKILAMTFTKKAKEEMQTRLVYILGEVGEKVKIRTYHGLAFQYLARNKTMLDGSNAWKIKKMFPEYRVKSDKFIEHANVAAHKYLLHEELSIDEESLLKKYKEMLNKTDMFTFDILIADFCNKLCGDKNFRVQLQKKYDFLLVDECQDNNKSQQIITKVIGAPQDNIFWVGDDDQCIYTFAGSSIANILDLKVEYPTIKEIFLEYNYRCHPKIVEAATNVIVSNSTRKLKVIKSGKKVENQEKAIEYLSFKNKEEEAIKIVDYCVEKASDNNKIAVLYRSKSCVNELLIEFAKRKIDVYVKDKINVLEDYDVKIINSYLMCMYGGSSFEDWKTMLRHGMPYVSNVQIENIYKNKDKYKILRKTIEEEPIEFKKEPWKEFYNRLLLIRKEIETNRLSLVNQIKYIKTNLNLCMDKNETNSKKEEVKNDTELYLHYLEIAKNVKSIKELYSEINRISEEATEDKYNILLFTVHSSKGKQFDEVFFIGLNEGITPAFKQGEIIDEKAEEEERRICYVGITRAINKMYFCTVMGDKEESRFIEESKQPKMRCDICSINIPKLEEFHCETCDKYYCPEHITICHVCGKKVCSNCAHDCECGDSICAECSDKSRCYICSKISCPDNKNSCSECRKIICSDHNYISLKTKKKYCENHLISCSKCDVKFAPDELVKCMECHVVLCLEDSYKCSVSNGYICYEHLISCEICGEKGSSYEVRSCKECGKKLCKTHYHKCSISGNYYCEDHVETCAICKKKLSSTEMIACNVCGITLCGEHSYKSEKTGKSYCKAHTQKCKTCNSLCGSNEVSFCEWCESYNCKECFSITECNKCQHEYCNTCISDNTCKACKNIVRLESNYIALKGIAYNFEGKKKVEVGIADKYFIYFKKKFFGTIKNGTVRIKGKL